MFVVKKSDFSRDFNSNNLLAQKQKEVKTWQWIILLGCFLLQMFPYCVALNLTSVFVPTDWAIWTQGDQTLMSITFTVGAVGAALIGPVIAKLFSSKINLRLFYSIGVFLGVLGFFGSAINTFVPFDHRTKGVAAAILYISNFVSQAGVMIFSGLGVNNLISKWWPAEKRGFALGIAFAGGSVGNIWMQQLVNALANKFGNNLGFIGNELPPDLGGGTRWATYLILSAMGLITGLLIVAFVCRKPVPPTELFATNNATSKTEIKCVGCGKEVNAKVNQAVALEASPLVTRKYPIYWILAFGYLILQMGTVHAAMNGSFIKNATQGVVGSADGSIFNNVMAIGGTLFGVSCLVGNFGGGILNDKIGPNKSIAIAGLGQVVAILCLMASAKIQALTYVYFILAGLSVYIYTSTPSYLCGRLYGVKQSNNHMAILGIFVALGYAISNSVIGTITGSVAPGENPHTLLGETTNGNMQGFAIFALVCMALGTIIVVICSTIIMKKGIKGLLNYSPTKYTKIITFKHSLANRFATLRILITKKDYRVNNDKRNQKIKNKLAKSKTYGTDAIYLKAIDHATKNSKLTTNEKHLLAAIFENNMFASNNVNKILKNKNVKETVDSLLKKKLIVEEKLGNIGSYYVLSTSLKNKLTIPNISNSITDDNQWLFNKLASIEAKTEQKVSKIKNKLSIEQAKSIDEAKQAKITNLSAKKIKKDQAKKDQIFKKAKNESDWVAYKKEYAILQKLYDDSELKNKLINKKQAKINKLNQKLMTSGYIKNYNEYQEVNGHNLLVDYYNNVYKHCDQLIDNLVANAIENKINIINKSVTNLQKKYNKQLGLEEKLVKEH